MVEILYDEDDDARRDREIEENMDCIVGASIPCGFFIVSVIVVIIIAQVADLHLDARNASNDDSFTLFGILLGLQAVLMIGFSLIYFFFFRRK